MTRRSRHSSRRGHSPPLSDLALPPGSSVHVENLPMSPKTGLYTSYFDLSHLFPQPEDLGYIVAGEYAAPKMDLLLDALLDSTEVLSFALGYHLRQLNVDVELFLPGDVQENAGHVLGAATGWCVTASMPMSSPGLHLDHVYVNQLLEAHSRDFHTGLAPRWIWTSPFDLHGLAFVLQRDSRDVRKVHEAFYTVLNEVKVLSQYPDQLHTDSHTE
ncbi:hypothetical protein AMAG_03334 [Allomyces macrogynus ATCC 38327]|uniref:Uncharacterized protein n=1 Tax=Allomyces macrogynus (strain ATCC 38327) TaxID=578462 RepID=A0A0L0S9B2_ALLM3|nr:hypothetical protein AMAG_03334 [Allomyces macrogynus ATCC 38327]|eukprot:KNE58980.1 hypothetical protein AMAG_03334 [Allomyces macrogynus ATCC 38327]